MLSLSLPGRFGLASLAFALCACGPKRSVYTSFQEPEFSPRPGQMEGYRVVLDPGHGGRFPGTQADDGTQEKNVNLGVALALEALLVEAGAEVVLTRRTDRDLLSAEPDGSLRDDLVERITISNRAEPDLFLSLHHNARPDPVGRFNQVETYHRMADNGPSRDAALRIHQHLSANLGIPEQAILPGNYLVLRRSEAPAVLGEASYLITDGMSEILVTPAAQKLEARAYFAGILDYLSRGLPHLEWADGRPPGSPVSIRRGAPFPAVHAKIRRRDDPPLDPQTIEVRIDDSPTPHVWDADRQAIVPAPLCDLLPGPHRLEIRARNTRGNAARTFFATLETAGPVESIRIVASAPPSLGPAGQRPLEFTLRDALGDPIPGRLPSIEIHGARWAAGPREVAAGRWRGWVAPSAPEGRVTLSLDGVADSLVWGPEPPPGPRRFLPLEISPGPSDGTAGRAPEPIPQAWVSPRTGAPEWRPTDTFGRVLVPREWAERDLQIRASGFWPRTWAGSPQKTQPIPLEPVVPSLLATRIVIDPGVGGDDPGREGSQGTREADANLTVSRQLSHYLRLAGAEVRLTRDEWSGASGVDRVQREGPEGAQLFITVRYQGTVPRIRHYPTSPNGRRAATLLSEELSALTSLHTPVGDGADFTLLMTTAPALVVALPWPAARETDLREPWFHRQFAWALFRGIARHFSGESPPYGSPARPPARSFRVTTADGLSAAGVAVQVGGAPFLQVTREGRLFRPFVPGDSMSRPLLAADPISLDGGPLSREHILTRRPP